MNFGSALGTSEAHIERRKHRRTDKPPLALRVAGEQYRALDWSLGGCRINDGTSRFQVKQQIEGRLDLESAEGRGEFVAEVVRVGANGDVGLRWLELPPDLFMAMGR
jgi:PilZ domain